MDLPDAYASSNGTLKILLIALLASRELSEITRCQSFGFLSCTTMDYGYKLQNTIGEFRLNLERNRVSRACGLERPFHPSRINLFTFSS